MPSLSHRCVVPAALAASVLLAGCGGSTTSGSATVGSATSGAATSAVTSGAATSGSVKPSPTTPNGMASKKTCTPPEVPGVIDGEDKCLMITQVCKQTADAQYRQFGFTCQQEKGRWVLRKK